MTDKIYPKIDKNLFLPHHDMKEDRIDVLYQFIQHYPLGTIITAGDNGIHANPYPFTFHMIDEQTKRAVIRCHIPRGSAQQVADLRSGKELLVVFNTAPDAYITPNWYPTKITRPATVPTWNFATVHVRGKPVVFDDEAWINKQITNLTDKMEDTTGIDPKWKVTDAPDRYVSRLIQELVGVEIEITSIEGKFKVSQGKDADLEGIVDGLKTAGHRDMAHMVKNHGANGCPFMRKAGDGGDDDDDNSASQQNGGWSYCSIQ